MSKSTISTFELFKMFPDAEAARVYMEAKRWPDGVVCPACDEAKRITTRKGGYYRCNACKTDFTVRTATIFERSHGQEGGMTEQSFTIRQQADAVGQAIEDADEHLTAEECVDRLPALRAAYETLRRMAAAEGDVSELPEELRPGRKVI